MSTVKASFANVSVVFLFPKKIRALPWPGGSAGGAESCIPKEGYRVSSQSGSLSQARLPRQVKLQTCFPYFWKSVLI